jgi:hypothetical protein
MKYCKKRFWVIASVIFTFTIPTLSAQSTAESPLQPWYAFINVIGAYAGKPAVQVDRLFRDRISLATGLRLKSNTDELGVNIDSLFSAGIISGKLTRYELVGSLGLRYYLRNNQSQRGLWCQAGLMYSFLSWETQAVKEARALGPFPAREISRFYGSFELGVGYRYIFRNGFTAGAALMVYYAMDRQVILNEPNIPLRQRSNEGFDYSHGPMVVTAGWVW